MRGGIQIKCRICGNEFSKIVYMKPSDDICSSKCHHVNFWNEIVREKEKHIVIDGWCYELGEESSTSPFRGFCGSRFKIKLDSGEIIETTNLWCQGDIPDSHRELLPDNAVFIKSN